MPRDLQSVERLEAHRETSASGGPSFSLTPFHWRGPSTLPKRDIIYGREIERGTVTVVLAPGGVGKTAFNTGTALALVTGRNLLGREVPGGPYRVALWNLEDPAIEIERLIHAAAIRFGVGADDIGGRMFVDSAMDGAGLNITRRAADGITIAEPVVDALTDELARRQIDVLIVDPFVSCHSAPENDNGAIDEVAKAWVRVANRARCAIILVHHAKKLAGAEVTVESSRGAVSLTDAARMVLTLNQMTKEEASKLGIDGLQHRRYFRVIAGKLSRAPAAEKADWYHLASIDLGNGDSVQCVEPWTPPDAFEGVTAANLYEVQKVIHAGSYRKSPQSPDWAGKAVAEVLGMDAGNKLDQARIKTMLAEWEKNGALIDVEKKDQKGNLRPFIEVGRWAGLDASPPRNSEVRNGEEVGLHHPHHHPPPLGGGWVRWGDEGSR